MIFMMTQRESLDSKDNTPACVAYKKNKLDGSYEQLALGRINFASVAYEWPKRLPDIMPDHQIGDIILVGGLVVDDHEPGAAVFRHQGKAGGRPYHKRGSDRDEQVAGLREFGGASHRIFRHRLPERDGGRLDRLAADGAIGRGAGLVEAPPDQSKVVSLSAADAAGVSGVAVQLDDVFGCQPRFLMQIVDVLGDHGGDLAGPVERSQCAVAAPWLRRGEYRLHRKAPPPCLVAGVLAGNEFIERDRAVAGPQSARRAEIGNAAFCRDAGTG